MKTEILTQKIGKVIISAEKKKKCIFFKSGNTIEIKY